jgi:hypothetical protein
MHALRHTNQPPVTIAWRDSRAARHKGAARGGFHHTRNDFGITRGNTSVKGQRCENGSHAVTFACSSLRGPVRARSPVDLGP